MTKLFTRIVAFFLIPCLLQEAALSAQFPAPSFRFSSLKPGTTTLIFSEQALFLPEVSGWTVSKAAAVYVRQTGQGLKIAALVAWRLPDFLWRLRFVRQPAMLEIPLWGIRLPARLPFHIYLAEDTAGKEQKSGTGSTGSTSPVGQPQNPEKPFNDLTKTPAYKFLSVLGLEGMARLSPDVAQRLPNGLSVIRIDVPPLQSTRDFTQGLGLLPHELGADARQFDLLYNSDGLLIGIFPVLSEDLIKRYQGPERLHVERLRLQYFDLSPYYLEVPQWGDAHASARWEAMVTAHNRDLLFTQRYLESAPLPLSRAGNRTFYAVAEANPQTGHLISQAHALSGSNPFNASPPADGTHRVIFPVLPTVFPPPPPLSSDHAYHLSLWGKSPHQNAQSVESLKKGDRVWVVGPGSGFDAWLASLVTQREIYVSGINPFEIANTQIFAELAGFKIQSRVFDNIADKNGQAAFRDIEVDWVLWNMPHLETEAPPRYDRRFSDSHDGDPEGLILQRFLWYLPDLLGAKGRARIWNAGSDYENIILRMAKAAGLSGRTDHITDENAVYTLSAKQAAQGRLGTRFVSFWPSDDFAAGSINDEEMWARWGQMHPWMYRFYTILLVNWEVSYFVPVLNYLVHRQLVKMGKAREVPQAGKILLAGGLLSTAFLLGALFVTPWLAIPAILSWALASGYMFAGAHKGKSIRPRQRWALGIVGIVLAVALATPWILFGIGHFVPLLLHPDTWKQALGWSIGLNFGGHSLYNLIALIFGWTPASMRISLGLHLETTQKLSVQQELLQTLRVTLRQGPIGGMLTNEPLARRLWDEAAKDGRIRTYDHHGMKFEYAVINKNGLSGVEQKKYAQLIASQGHAFSQPLFDPMTASNYREAMARGDWLLFVDDGFFENFEAYPAVHEFGERVTAGNHHLATKLEFNTAAEDHQLIGRKGYLAFLRRKYLRKLSNAYAERRFGGEQDKDPELKELMEKASLTADAEAIRKKIETFTWPHAVDVMLAEYKATHEQVEACTDYWAVIIAGILDLTPQGSPEKLLRKANQAVGEMFKQIRGMNLSNLLDSEGLRAQWQKHRIAFGRAYDVKRQAYQTATDSGPDYMDFVTAGFADLNTYGFFGEDFDLLMHPDKKLSAAQRQQQQRAAIQLLQSASEDDRSTAAERLGELRATEAQGLLIEFLRLDPAPTVRIAAAIALGRLAERNPVQCDPIVHALSGSLLGGFAADFATKDADARVRDAALVALSGIPNLRDVLSAGDVAYALDDEDFYVRVDAAHVLLEASSENAAILARKLRSGGDQDFNRALLEMLGDRLLFLTQEDTDVVDAVRNFGQRERDPELKASAAEVLRRILDNTKRADTLLRQPEPEAQKKSAPTANPDGDTIARGQEVVITGRGKPIPFDGLKGKVLGVRVNPKRGYTEAVVEVVFPGTSKPKKIAVPVQFLKVMKAPDAKPVENLASRHNPENAANNIGLRILRLVQALGLPISDEAVKRWSKRMLRFIEIPGLIVAVGSAFLHPDSSWAAHLGQNIFSMLPVTFPHMAPDFMIGVSASLGIFLMAHVLFLVFEHLARGDSLRNGFLWLRGVPAQTAVFSLYVFLPLISHFIGLPPDLGVLIAGGLHLRYDLRAMEDSASRLTEAPRKGRARAGYRLLRLAAALVMATHLLPLVPSAGGPADVPTSIAFEQPADFWGTTATQEIFDRVTSGPQLRDLGDRPAGSTIEEFVRKAGIQVFFYQFIKLDIFQQEHMIESLGQTNTRGAIDILVFLLRSNYDSHTDHENVTLALIGHPLARLAVRDLIKIVHSSVGGAQYGAIRILRSIDSNLGFEASLVGYLRAELPEPLLVSKLTIHRSEMPSWPFFTSADTKVYEYLKNWIPSENSVLTSRSRQLLLDLIEHARRHGIKHPLRLNRRTLEAILENRDANHADGRRLDLVVFPEDDWNTAFADSDEISSMIGNGDRVMFYEAKTKFDVIQILTSSAKQQAATVIEFGGHGWQKGMIFGTTALPPVWPFTRYYLTTSDEAALTSVRGALAPRGHVIIKSCSPGKGGSRANNMENMMWHVFPQAAKVWAPLQDANLSRLIFNWQTHAVEKAEYSYSTQPRTMLDLNIPPITRRK